MSIFIPSWMVQVFFVFVSLAIFLGLLAIILRSVDAILERRWLPFYFAFYLTVRKEGVKQWTRDKMYVLVKNMYATDPGAVADAFALYEELQNEKPKGEKSNV